MIASGGPGGECDKLNKINILHRSSLRGLKKCGVCGQINGQRAVICRNNNCELRKRMLADIKPFDPIQLVTQNDIRLFSLRRTKDKHPTHVRSFVEIRQSCKAVCYVDTCKYDTNTVSPTGFNCRHVKAIYSVDSDFQQAEVYPVDKTILWNLNITEEQKTKLWDLYRREESDGIPSVQRLNSSTFVVACDNLKNFSAGRLHVMVCTNSVSNKKGFYLCACKRLKIVVEPDNSVIMKKEICDHLLLLLAAILSASDSRSAYSAFLDTLQHLWMTSTVSAPTPPVDSSTSHFLDFDMSLIDSEDRREVAPPIGAHNSQDLFNFSDELFADNVSIFKKVAD